MEPREFAESEVAGPPPPGRFTRWLTTGGNLRGAAGGIVALILVGTVVALNVREPANGTPPEVLASVRTLVIAVAAFYFGSRLRRRGEGEQGQVEPMTEQDASEMEEAARRSASAATMIAEQLARFRAERAESVSMEPSPEEEGQDDEAHEEQGGERGQSV
jgi:hypothetical protein